MKKIVGFILTSLLFTTFALAKQPVEKIIVDLTTGNIDTVKSRFIKGVANTTNHFKQKGSAVETVVIIHGEAYRYFIKDLDSSKYSTEIELHDSQQELRKGFENLTQKYKIRFEVCSVGMKKNQLTSDMFYDFVHVVPSAQISLIEWQNKGYAYLPIQ